jgi:hypothetical protein
VQLVEEELKQELVQTQHLQVVEQLVLVQLVRLVILLHVLFHMMVFVELLQKVIHMEHLTLVQIHIVLWVQIILGLSLSQLLETVHLGDVMVLMGDLLVDGVQLHKVYHLVLQ